MATRFRFPSGGSPDASVAPALQSYSHSVAVRRPLILGADTSTLTTDTLAPDAADHIAAGDVFIAQFVSRPVVKGSVLTNGAAFKLAVQCLEANAGNNLQLQVFINVVSNDGTSAIQTVRSKQAEGTEVNTALRNVFHSGTLSAGHTFNGGERIVVELSLTGTPTASGGVQGHNGSMRFGGSGASGDLPENDTETGTAFNPWIEFADNIFLELPAQRVITNVSDAVTRAATY